MMTLQGAPFISILQVGGWACRAEELAYGQKLESVVELGLEPGSVLALKHIRYGHFCISPSPRDEPPFYLLILCPLRSFHRFHCLTSKASKAGGEVAKYRLKEARGTGNSCRWAERKE